MYNKKPWVAMFQYPIKLPKSHKYLGGVSIAICIAWKSQVAVVNKTYQEIPKTHEKASYMKEKNKTNRAMALDLFHQVYFHAEQKFTSSISLSHKTQRSQHEATLEVPKVDTLLSLVSILSVYSREISRPKALDLSQSRRTRTRLRAADIVSGKGKKNTPKKNL